MRSVKEFATRYSNLTVYIQYTQGASTSRQAAGEESESDVPPFTMGATVPPSLGDDDYIHANYVDDYWHGKADSPVQ